jgi:hypothetical protein
MIICLGPICFPIWHLLPVLFLLFAKAKDWFNALFGVKKEAVVAEKEKDVAEEATNIETEAESNGSELRQRKKGGGVTTVESAEHWEKILKVKKVVFVLENVLLSS